METLHSTPNGITGDNHSSQANANTNLFAEKAPQRFFCASEEEVAAVFWQSADEEVKRCGFKVLVVKVGGAHGESIVASEEIHVLLFKKA